MLLLLFPESSKNFSPSACHAPNLHDVIGKSDFVMKETICENQDIKRLWKDKKC
jgi:hypothetical protein